MGAVGGGTAMRQFALALILVLAGAAVAAAQNAPGTSPTYADVTCAGMMTTEAVPYDTYVISGEQADPKTIFSIGDYIYINKGASQGAKVGDTFMLMRPEGNYLHVEYYDGEHGKARELGTVWTDVARIRVVVTHPEVSIAQITYACGAVQRGDYVRPAVDYPVPPFRSLRDFDRFAPPSGKPQGTVVRAKDYRALADRDSVVYVNLPDAKVGDYVRFFHYSADKNTKIYQVGGMSDHVFLWGGTPTHYGPHDLPREVIGEGVVLRVTKTSASVMLYNMLREVFIGDRAEIE
jgi:hypothetical protein